MRLQDRLYLPNAWPMNPPGILSGISQLDDNLGGLQRGLLHVLSAPPGIGATTLLLKFANNAARHTAIVVATTAIGANVVDQMIRLRLGYARGSVMVRHPAADEMIGRSLRYPVEIVDQIRNIDELQPKIDIALDLLRSQDWNPGLLAIDCPAVLTPEHIDSIKTSVLKSLQELARKNNIAIVVNLKLAPLGEPEYPELFQDEECMIAGPFVLEPEWHQESPPPDTDVHMILQRCNRGDRCAGALGNRMLQVLRARDRTHLRIPIEIEPDEGTCEELGDVFGAELKNPQRRR
ncbi:MAG: hypothetical protein IPN71_08520 [Fibrobacteres bacterium]|nr:hypothetical protein [Fibrobacterota bacterium]